MAKVQINLRDLLQHEIEDLYSAEEQIIEALPKMIKKASDRELKAALDDHLRVTKDQKTRLDKVKKLLTGEPSDAQKGFFERFFGSGTKCKGTEGLIKEGEKIMSEDMDPAVMDAAIIASCQKIEHYEISGYGTARAYAAELGLSEVARLLETTLNEEYKADASLTSLATRKVNLQAGGSPATAGARIPKIANNPLQESRTVGPDAKNAGIKKTATKKMAVKKAAAKKGAAKKGATKR